MLGAQKMRTGEDKERELVAAVRNLLTQSGRPEGDDGDSMPALAGPASSSSGEHRTAGVREPQKGLLSEQEQSAPSSPPSDEKAEIRTLIDSLGGLWDNENDRTMNDDDPVRALLDRIEGSGRDQRDGRAVPLVGHPDPSEHLSRATGLKEDRDGVDPDCEGGHRRGICR